MAFIPRLIQTILARNAIRAQLTPGKPIMIERGGELSSLSSRPLEGTQLEKMVAEVVPDHLSRKLKSGASIEFPYHDADVPVTIQVYFVGAKMSMVVTVPGAQPEERSDGGWLAAHETPEPAIEIPHRSDAERLAASSEAFASLPEAVTAPPIGGEVGPRHVPFVGSDGGAKIDRYLRIMFEEGCSDLHLSSQNPPLYRLDGEISHLRNMPHMSPAQVEELILEIMPDVNYEAFMSVSDTDFAHEISGVGRFRVNAFRDRLGPGAVLRIIPSDILTAEVLNLPKGVMDLCWLNKGLVVVTGPTGSGKSTTLAALIDYINRNRAMHIITIEDPIEFVHPTKKALINQREVGVHTKTFKAALRAALREDPDILLVGEMRDLETIEIAIETAETGHLVFGTLHTNTAPSTVDRIIDQFPTDRQSQVRTMLSESLRAVIAQTLCKKIGGGRAAALEILMCTHAMSNLIREGKTFQIPSMMSTGKKSGMILLNDSLMQLVKSGKVEPKEAYLKSVDKSSLRLMLERDGFRLEL